MAVAFENDINILLLGESGVGKSTFINAFANYLTFDELPTMPDQNLVSLIPASFTMYDENDEERTISFGKENAHDSFAVGEASTRSTSCYEFPLVDKKVRIIDTPGIGDPRGIEQDNINFENILMFINNFDNLHCICILLKPNNARLSITFDFCIKQLLCHLQKDASKNIVFVYTNARSTFYKPGDTGPLLKKMLENIENNPPFVKIPHDPNRVYCMDNEAFRFILALHEGVKFDRDTTLDFSASWNKSAKECQRLLKYIIGCPEENVPPLPPHSIKDTISLNKARSMILDLCRPLADIIDNISVNIAVLNKHMTQIDQHRSNLKTLEEKLYIPIVKMRVVPFENPQTACTSMGCSEVQSIEGVQRYVNKKICHDPCHLKNVTQEIIGPEALRDCEAMDHESGLCLVCGCSYQVHIHKYYGIKEVSAKVIDIAVQTQFNAESDARNRVEEILAESQNRINAYTREKKVVTKAMADFAHFLRNNAIICYNDAFINYVKYKIENLNSLNANGVDNRDVVNQLNLMIAEYELNIKTLEKAMSNASGNKTPNEISADDVLKIIDQLRSLPISGAKITEMQTAQDRMIKQQTGHRIIVVEGIQPYKMFSFIRRGIQKGKNMLTAMTALNPNNNY